MFEVIATASLVDVTGGTCTSGCCSCSVPTPDSVGVIKREPSPNAVTPRPGLMNRSLLPNGRGRGVG
jgi:hypothetical protein